MLRDVNQSTVFDISGNRAGGTHRQTASATLSTDKRRSLVDFSPSRTLPKSDTFKGQCSKRGSDSSKFSERRRLEMQAKLLGQQSQLEIEKRRREIFLERKKRQMEMEMNHQKLLEMNHQKLLDLQTEAEIAEMEIRKAIEQQKKRIQIR